MKMLKDVIVKIAEIIQSLDSKKFQQYLLLFLICIATSVVALIFYINNQSLEIIKQTKRIETFANKSVKLLSSFQKLKQEETRISEMLEKDKEFNIKSYFEQFCKDQNLTPESGWEDTKIQDISEKFSEIELSSTFKGLTTDKIVSILEALDKKKIIYTKEVIVKSEGNKKISLELNLATIKAK